MKLTEKTISEQRNKYLEESKNLDYPSFVYGLGIRFKPEINLDEIEVEPIDIRISENFDQDNTVEGLHSIGLPKDKLLLFHKAVANTNIIKIPNNTKKTITVDTLTNGFSSLFISVGKNCSINIEEFQTSNKKGYRSEVILIIIDENSKVNYKTLQNLNKETKNIVFRKALLYKNSSLNWIDAHIGSYFTRLHTETHLLGENAETKTNSLFLGKNRQQYDIVNNAYHKLKHTNTDIKTKTILKDSSKSLVQGLIKIEKDAQFSNGNQKEEALLLNQEAEANAIPNLEIENQEVSCRHGSSIGRLDKDHIFYLQSKGLTEEQAKTLLIEGFMKPILDLFDDKAQGLLKL